MFAVLFTKNLIAPALQSAFRMVPPAFPNFSRIPSASRAPSSFPSARRTAASVSPDLSSARARGLSRILVARSSDFPELYQFVATGTTDRPTAHRDTLLGRLTHAPATRPPRTFALDPALTESVSRTNLYALPCKGPNTFAPEHLDWAVYSLSDP